MSAEACSFARSSRARPTNTTPSSMAGSSKNVRQPGKQAGGQAQHDASGMTV
jgi:hypothetical protein